MTHVSTKHCRLLSRRWRAQSWQRRWSSRTSRTAARPAAGVPSRPRASNTTPLTAFPRTKRKNNKKSLPEPVGQSFPQIWRLNPVLKLVGLGYREVWDTLWCLLAGFGALLGGSWLLLGSPEQALGTYLAALGRLVAGLGRHLEGFWFPGPPRAFILKGFGVFRGCVFRWFLLLLALCYLMRCFDAVTIIVAFTVTIFPFFRCGGLCAAHGIFWRSCRDLPKTILQVF